MARFGRNALVRPALVAAVFFAGMCSAYSQQLRIELNFDQEFNQVGPSPRLVSQLVDVSAVMNVNGNIQSTNNSHYLGGKHHGKHEYVDVEEKTIGLGRSSEEEWKVAGQNRLINIVDFPSSKRAILLTVNGTSCSAQVDYELKPGFTDYQFIRKNGKLG